MVIITLTKCKKKLIGGLALTAAAALLFGAIGIATDSWAVSRNGSIAACDASIDVHCSLYKRYMDGTYFCSDEANTNATAYDASDTSDLACGALNDESVECSDLTTSQNAAAINLFMLCATILSLGALHYFKDRPTEAKNLLIASMLAELVACLCAFITAGSYRSYLEAVSSVDLYFTASSGESLFIGTLDIDWDYEYSWALTITSGLFSVTCFFFSLYLYFSDLFVSKRRGKNGLARGDIEELPTVRNALGVPLVPEGEDDGTGPTLNYEL